jgi:ABC-type thiamine transport system ATPase subunit
MKADRLVCREFHRNDWLVSVLLLDEAFRALMKRVLATMRRIVQRPFQRVDAKFPESPSSQSGDD